MALYIGLDVGTTTLAVIVLDAQTGEVVASNAVANEADTTTPEDKARGHAELDLTRLGALMVKALRGAAAQVSSRSDNVRGIGVTGQMHGVALLGSDLTPLGPAITWQDRRVEAMLPGKSQTYLQRFISLAGGYEAFERMGCMPATGFLGPTLYWLRVNDLLPAAPALACFIPDVAVATLMGLPPCTDPTDAGSSGIFDVVSRQWDWPLIDRLGLPRSLFPEVRESGERAGGLLSSVADETGLPRGMPVFVALGDNQASFLGSVREPTSSVLLNVGTGGQISALIDRYQRLPDLDTRSFPGGRYLLVGAGLFGGRSYAYFRDFLSRVGVALFGARGDEELYDEVTRLAASVPPGSDGLCCSPLFTGTRSDPSLRASFSGIGPNNFTPGHLARALLEGMADGFLKFHRQMLPVAGGRAHLVGAGNGIRRNHLLAEILATAFRKPLWIAEQEEAAATGAALVAATGAGEIADLNAATSLLRYRQAVPPFSE